MNSVIASNCGFEMDDLITELISPLCEGLIEMAVGPICRITAVRRVFGWGPYIEPKIEFSEDDLRQMREWDALDAIQRKYAGEPTYVSGFLSLGLSGTGEQDHRRS